MAAPDVVVYSSTGCDNRFMTPHRPATITSELIQWRIAYNHNGGPDCDSTHLVFIRLSGDVFDMQHDVRVALAYRSSLSRGHASPAPDLGRWAVPR